MRALTITTVFLKAWKKQKLGKEARERICSTVIEISSDESEEDGACMCGVVDVSESEAESEEEVASDSDGGDDSGAEEEEEEEEDESDMDIDMESEEEEEEEAESDSEAESDCDAPQGRKCYVLASSGEAALSRMDVGDVTDASELDRETEEREAEELERELKAAGKFSGDGNRRINKVIEYYAAVYERHTPDKYRKMIRMVKA